MGHVIEPAASGRAKCRGCGQAIAKGELRLGERLPNPFADEGDMTLWFHLECAAYKRPEPLLEVLDAAEGPVDRADWLRAEAQRGVEHRRLPRLDGAQRAPSGRAACRCCRETIAKDEWRLRLVYFDQGRFEPSGFIHVGCAAQHLGTADVRARVRRFTPDASQADLAEIEAALGIA